MLDSEDAMQIVKTDMANIVATSQVDAEEKEVGGALYTVLYCATYYHWLNSLVYTV